ncbi:hypothetical protein ACFW84_36610 [Streptomyces anulatus]|uniref:hypothetical protein n=1 Tax=Streptomyces anulatus TaxID=1892 RepID=UPI0036B3254E
MTTFDSPEDLRAAQSALHRTNSEFEQYARTLPWSAEPMPAREADKQLHSGYRPSRPESPGYTEDQHRQVAAYRERLLELGVQVATHPFWKTLDAGLVVAAHIQLKHVDDEPPVGEAGAGRALARPSYARCQARSSGVRSGRSRCQEGWRRRPERVRVE